MEQRKSKKPESKSLSEPAQDYRLGDLTPAYIEWFAETHTPKEFHSKYVSRRNRVPKELQKYFII